MDLEIPTEALFHTVSNGRTPKAFVGGRNMGLLTILKVLG